MTLTLTLTIPVYFNWLDVSESDENNPRHFYGQMYKRQRCLQVKLNSFSWQYYINDLPLPFSSIPSQ